MPHAGLMEEQRLGPVEGPLQRARLHIRGGKRRLRQGKISAGIVTLYDAVSAAMDFYAATHGGNALAVMPGENIHDERTLYSVLVRSGVVDGAFDFTAFDRLTETALDSDLNGYDYRPLLAGIELLMQQLGVMPFDEAVLPAEDPATF
ncbi:MAG TPA: hypothetical protein VL197_13775 [Nitrospirota bacterium]|nr:hypothetical protein [Nitrospirota bacterium]